MEIEKKLVISFPEKKQKTIAFNDVFIKIDPFISVNDRMDLIKTYFEALNKSEDIVTGYVFAEYSLILGILDKCTNIEIEELKVDDVLKSGLWDKITHEIENYHDLISDRNDILYKIEKQNSSLIEITELMNEFADNFSEISKFVKDEFSKISSKIMEILNNVDSANLDELKDAFLNFGKDLSKLEERIPGILTTEKTEEVKKTKKPGRPKKTE